MQCIFSREGRTLQATWGGRKKGTKCEAFGEWRLTKRNSVGAHNHRAGRCQLKAGSWPSMAATSARHGGVSNHESTSRNRTGQPGTKPPKRMGNGERGARGTYDCAHQRQTMGSSNDKRRNKRKACTTETAPRCTHRRRAASAARAWLYGQGPSLVQAPAGCEQEGSQSLALIAAAG